MTGKTVNYTKRYMESVLGASTGLERAYTLMKMEESIKQHLIPVRPHIEYEPDNCIPPHLTRVCSIETKEGVRLTKALPFSWVQWVCFTLNRGYINRHTNSAGHGDDLLVLQIPEEPWEKTESQTIAYTASGSPTIEDNKPYLAHIKKLCNLGESLFLYRFTNVPIEEPVNIKATYYTATKKCYTLPLLNAWLLDLLEKSSIIKSKNSRIVVSMDGCCIQHDKEPKTIVTISRAKGKTNERGTWDSSS